MRNNDIVSVAIFLLASQLLECREHHYHCHKLKSFRNLLFDRSDFFKNNNNNDQALLFLATHGVCLYRILGFQKPAGIGSGYTGISSIFLEPGHHGRNRSHHGVSLDAIVAPWRLRLWTVR